MKNPISIEFGKEFKVINYAKTNDFFTKQYSVAKMYLEEIVHANKSLNEFEEPDNSVNNIIAFTGERGQGKTSAMLSFVNSLKSDERFSQLDVVDPSTFEDMHNVVEVIVTKMYNKTLGHNQNDMIDDNTYSKISEGFQKVYEGLSLVRNPKKFDDLESDYEGTIQKIGRAGDSAKLKQNMFELVERYLDIINVSSPKKRRPSFLIIQIDDIDINISLVYKMTEQIRKYLMIPNVIIVMAVKIEQLKFCIELQFRKEMSQLKLNEQEPVTMAAKYVEKLIPDGRKIALPDLRLLAGDDEQDATEKNQIEYLENGENLLLRYQGRGLETTILGYIHEKTGLHFIKRAHRVHPIVPNTLRELVNLLSVLGRMKPQDKLNNLITFENYFFNTWIPNNLDKGYVDVLRRIHTTNYLSMNQTVGAILLDKLNTEIFTLDTRFTENGSKKFNDIKEYFRGKKSDQVSLGDIQELIHFFDEYFTDEEPKSFAFSLQTLYSIIMNKLAFLSLEQLYHFIHGSIWGHEIIPWKNSNSFKYNNEPKVHYCIQAEGAYRYSRTYFTYNPQHSSFLQDMLKSKDQNYISSNVLNEIDKDQLVDMLYFSDFHPVFIRKNWSIDNKPIFNMENIFVSSIYPQCIHKKLGEFSAKDFPTENKYGDILNIYAITQIATNVELSAFVLEYIGKDTIQLRDKEEEGEHIKKMLNNIDAALRIEAEGRAGEALSIFKDNDKGKKWMIDIYMYYWNIRTSARVLEVPEFIQWLKDNILKRTCKISTFKNRYDVINEFLRINEVMLDLVPFNEIREELNQLYLKDEKQGDKISPDTRQKYNQLSDELITGLEYRLSQGV